MLGENSSAKAVQNSIVKKEMKLIIDQAEKLMKLLESVKKSLVQQTQDLMDKISSEYEEIALKLNETYALACMLYCF